MAHGSAPSNSRSTFARQNETASPIVPSWSSMWRTCSTQRRHRRSGTPSQRVHSTATCRSGCEGAIRSSSSTRHSSCGAHQAVCITRCASRGMRCGAKYRKDGAGEVVRKEVYVGAGGAEVRCCAQWQQCTMSLIRLCLECKNNGSPWRRRWAHERTLT